MFSIFKKSSREEAFQPTRVSLIYPQQLKAELAPFVQGSGAKQSLLTGEARDEALGEIVRRYIPEPTMHALKSMAMGTEKTPVVIENLPTEPETVAQAGRHKHRVPPEELYSSAIARGLYRAVGISPVRDTVLRRPDPQAIIHGLAMHRDEKDFSILTCATNRDRAPTVFIDLKAVMEGMSRKERIAMRVKEVTSGPYEVTLQDVYDITQRQGYGGFTELTVLNPSPKYQKLLAEHSCQVTLEPGQMAMFNNNLIYHKAEPGIEKIEVKDNEVSRLVVFTSGERRGRG